MIRSQIYLTENERSSLKSIAEYTGRTQSDLIREAVDSLIVKMKKTNSNEQRKKAFGLWEKKDSYPDIATLRSELNRDF